MQRYVTGDRPSFLLRLTGNDGFEKCYSVHREAMRMSGRFKHIESRGLLDLRHSLSITEALAAQPPTKRKKSNTWKQNSTGELVKVLEFHIGWLDAYAKLCPNSPEPFEWLIYHLYEAADAANDCDPANACFHDGEALCPADEAISDCDLELPAICTNLVDTPSSASLVVLLRLFDWFRCPTQLSNHVLWAILHGTLHNEMTAPRDLPHLRPLLRFGDPAQRKLCDFLCDAACALRINARFELVPDPRAHTFAGLHTKGYALPDSQSDERDCALLYGRFMCEHLVNDTPALQFVEERVNAYVQEGVFHPSPFEDYDTENLCGVGFVHITDSMLMEPPAPGIRGFHNFRFGALRDLRYVDRVLGNARATDCIRLRTEKLKFSVSWMLEEGGTRLTIVMELNCRRALPYVPVFRLEAGVLNVFHSDAIDSACEDDQDLYGAISSTHSFAEPRSKFVTLSAMLHERQACESELDIRRERGDWYGTEQASHSCTWSLDFCRLRGSGSGDDMSVLPPRLLGIRGSVSFCNQEIADQ